MKTIYNLKGYKMDIDNKITDYSKFSHLVVEITSKQVVREKLMNKLIIVKAKRTTVCKDHIANDEIRQQCDRKPADKNNKIIKKMEREYRYLTMVTTGMNAYY